MSELRKPKWYCKKHLFACPPDLLSEVDRVAKIQSRNRSGLIREALRLYIREFEAYWRTHRSVKELSNESRVES